MHWVCGRRRRGEEGEDKATEVVGVPICDCAVECEAIVVISP